MSNKDFITVVSGLPRSGTSMMMGMLDAGGIKPMVDGIREKDEDNPKGYYEFERVKKLKEDQAWLDDAKGMVVKVISQLLLDLPAGHQYKIIFMRRNINEILASQKQMLIRRGTFREDGVKDEDMGKMLLMHVDQVMKKVNSQDFMEIVEVDYNQMLKDASQNIIQINAFLGGDLDTKAMGEAIDQKLYRQRK